MVARLGSRTLRVRRFAQRSSPVLLDLAGFTAITVGVYLLFGAWAWVVAGGLLVLAGFRAQS
jgi:hypothetical protein